MRLFEYSHKNTTIHGNSRSDNAQTLSLRHNAVRTTIQIRQKAQHKAPYKYIQAMQQQCRAITFPAYQSAHIITMKVFLLNIFLWHIHIEFKLNQVDCREFTLHVSKSILNMYAKNTCQNSMYLLRPWQVLQDTFLLFSGTLPVL